MPELVFSERFANDLAAVTSQKAEASVWAALDNVEAFPEIGSPNVPDAIRREFGDGVRKMVVGPFDLVYTIGEVDGKIHVEALVHQRAAW